MRIRGSIPPQRRVGDARWNTRQRRPRMRAGQSATAKALVPFVSSASPGIRPVAEAFFYAQYDRGERHVLAPTSAAAPPTSPVIHFDVGADG